ncbi:MAG: DUF58 domain-containing protein [Chloroflexota bacterium]|jgi:uncharacterized protein (DUF58 family)
MADKAINEPLFDEQTLRKLEQLTLVAERVRAGVMKGDRRSRKRGTSLEFADYRDYARGDDLRRLDWNVFARLERPFIKLLEEEEDLAVHLLIDGSGSMDWPLSDDEHNKFNYARRLAAALAVIGLAAGDQVNMAVLRANGNTILGPYRGRPSAVRAMQLLASSTAQGVTDLSLALRQYGWRAYRPGLLVLISDLFSPNGFQAGLDELQARGYEVALVQLLSPDEVRPAYQGDVRLVDVETGEDAEISLDHLTVQRYQQRLDMWQQDTAAYCAKRTIHYIPVVTDISWHVLVMRTMRVHGLLR